MDAAAADNAAINKVGGGSAFTCEQTLGFHPGAFAFATADLVKPKGVHMCAREVLDGISLRVVKHYDISTDSFPCRLDVLYGYQTLRGGQAVRIGHNT